MHLFAQASAHRVLGKFTKQGGMWYSDVLFSFWRKHYEEGPDWCWYSQHWLDIDASKMMLWSNRQTWRNALLTAQLFSHGSPFTFQYFSWQGGNFSWRNGIFSDNLPVQKITWSLKGKRRSFFPLWSQKVGNLDYEAWRWLEIPARDHEDVPPWPSYHITTVWHLLGVGSHSNLNVARISLLTWYFSAPQTFHKVLLNLTILF